MASRMGEWPRKKKVRMGSLGLHLKLTWLRARVPQMTGPGLAQRVPPLAQRVPPLRELRLARRVPQLTGPRLACRALHTMMPRLAQRVPPLRVPMLDLRVPQLMMVMKTPLSRVVHKMQVAKLLEAAPA